MKIIPFTLFSNNFSVKTDSIDYYFISNKSIKLFAIKTINFPSYEIYKEFTLLFSKGIKGSTKFPY